MTSRIGACNRRLHSLWEESKMLHRAGCRARANEFQKTFEKTWSLLRIPFFYILLFRLIFPSFRRRFTNERNAVRAEIAKIVAEYAPQIRDALVMWEDSFRQWERENAGPSLCGSEDAFRKEEEARKQARKLSAEMLDRIGAIPKYGWHFHPVENPAKMVENPYPGFLSTERGQNYCDSLIQAFG